MNGPVSTGFRWQDEIRRGADYVARLSLTYAGAAVVASASLRLLKPDGTEAWAGSAAVASAAASVTVPASATEDEDPATGWLFEWTATDTDGDEDTYLQPVDVVLHSVKPTASWTDLTQRHVDIARLTGDDAAAGQAKGNQAWAVIMQALRARGKRPCLIVDSFALREPHILLWLSMVYGDLATGGDESSEGQRSIRYRAEFQALWDGTNFELADPALWQRTGRREATRGPLFLGSTGTGQFRPIPATLR